MKRLDELTARLTALAQEYKQIKLSIAAKNPPNTNAKVAFSPEEAQDFNAKVNKFHGIKDKVQLDEAGKMLAEELKTLIPAFLAKYLKVAEGQQKQLAGVKDKA
jgi:surfactin synthase thioesterase subunit